MKRREENPTPFDLFLVRVVRYGLFGVFLLPFLVHKSYLYPWVTGKVWGLELLVEILFPFWAVLALRRKEFRPSRGPLLWAMLAFFAVATLSMALGDDPHRSFWSKPDRLTGLFFQYHLLGLFLMASTAWRGMTRKAAAAFVIAASVAALHGVLQAYLGVKGGIGDRGAAAFGNPSYLAQYLVPAFFVALWLMAGTASRAGRWGWGLLAALAILGMFASRSRGAMVALALSGLAAALFLSFRGDARQKRAGRLVLAGLFALALLFSVLDRWGPSHQWLYDQRLSVQYFQESAGPRQLLIRNAFKGIADRPLLGWGPENFESAYYFHYDPATLRYSDYETRQDRPHNILLEVLANLGVLGFLAWAALYLAAWRTGRPLLALSSFSLVAFNLFIFESAWSWTMNFLLFAFIAAEADHGPEQGSDRWARFAPLAGLAAGALALAVLFGILAPMIGASKRAAALLVGIQSGNLPPARLEREIGALIASRSPLAERNVRAVASHLAVGRGQARSDAYRPALEKAAMFEAEMAELRPNDYVLSLVAAASLSGLRPRTDEQQEAFERAVIRMHALAPNRQEVQWYDAELREQKGELDLAEALYRRALELAPGVAPAKAELARFLLEHGRIEEAISLLSPEMLERDPSLHAIVGRAMIAHFNARRFDALYAIYAEGRANGIAPAEWLITGAVAAAALGDREEAERIAEETKRMYPERSELLDSLLRAHEAAADAE